MVIQTYAEDGSRDNAVASLPRKSVVFVKYAYLWVCDACLSRQLESTVWDRCILQCVDCDKQYVFMSSC